jgi:hypothetical protein
MLRPAAPLQLSATGTTTTTTTTAPPTPHPRQADLDSDKSQIAPVSGLRDFQSKVRGLKVIAKAAGAASVVAKIDKLFDAVARTRLQLVKPAPDGYGPTDGAAKITEWIDSRIAIVEGYLSGNFIAAATTAHTAIESSGTVNPTDQFDPDWGVLVDFAKGSAAFGPEEAFSIGDLGTIQGVFKVYDLGKVFGMMGQTYRDAWDREGAARGLTGQALFAQECQSAGRMVYAPAGKGTTAPFAGANADKVFSAARPVSAFVGLARDATATSFADALVKYQLKASYYPSNMMMACQVDASVLTQNWGSIRLGKPSIMNLLVFDENVYDETDRTFGHLADPADPSKPGAALELTIIGMPLADFMRAGGTQVLT